MKVFAQWLEYPAHQGPYGSGGWSRSAKRRPAPVLKEVTGNGEMKGKAWVIDGVRKLKLNVWSLEDGHELKRDYPDYAAPAWVRDILVRSVVQASLTP